MAGDFLSSCVPDILVLSEMKIRLSHIIRKPVSGVVPPSNPKLAGSATKAS